MAIDFSKAKESCLRSISFEIDWADEAGEAYLKDVKKGGGFDPSLADLDRYRGMKGWPKVEEAHAKALALLEAENIEDLDSDAELAYDVFLHAIFEQEDVSPKEALETFERYANMGMTDASLKTGLLRFVGYGYSAVSERRVSSIGCLTKRSYEALIEAVLPKTVRPIV